MAAAQPNGTDHLIKQIAHWPRKRFAMLVIIAVRRFANDHHICVHRPVAKDKVPRTFFQFAMLERPHRTSERFQRLC